MSASASLPFLFKRVGRHNLVHFVDPETLDWSQGFFKYVLPLNQPIDRMEPFDIWLARESDAATDFGDVGAIFHVSRCGSTLLTQNIKATGRAIVLSEPPFFRILRHRMKGTLDEATALRAALAMLHVWARWARSQGKQLVIKFNSQMHALHTELMAAMASARFAFLHREPLPVLESIERGPPQYLLRESGLQRHDDLPELAKIDEDPVLLAAANRYCGALLAFGRLNDQQLMSLSYDTLAPRFTELCEHLGVGPVAQGAWDAVTDAKIYREGAATRYKPVGEKRLADFAEKHSNLLAIAQSHYHAYLDRSGVGAHDTTQEAWGS